MKINIERIGGLKKGYERLLLADLEAAAVESMVHYAEAAAKEIPVWTGYTRAIWRGVVTYLQSKGATETAAISFVGSKPWFYPPQPTPRYNRNLILDHPDDQFERGFNDGYEAIKVYKYRSSVIVKFSIPAYDGEINYALQEEDWRSLAAGRLAFDKHFRKHKIKANRYLINS
jgi:hypothetical protein